MSGCLHRDDDIQAMKLAIEQLMGMGHDVTRKSPYQLKVGAFNFYPGTGTITKDGAPPIREKGIDHFIDLLPKRGAFQPSSTIFLSLATSGSLPRL